MAFKNRPAAVSPKMGQTMVMFLVLLVAFVLYVVSEKQIDRANDKRQLSHQFADQWRQSSEELTRMARTYVVTGNPLYKQHYQDILDIRDGKKRRPQGSTFAYWDRVPADPQAPRADNGPPIALLELMRQAGFPDEGFEKLAAAKANSDSLSALELEAMKLAESVGPEAQARRARAYLILNDENYHRGKAAMMKPINEFFLMMDKRTLATVRRAEDIALLFRVIFVAISLAMIFMLWRAYAALRAMLGGSADEVRQQMLRIGRGDFSGVIPVAPGMEDSVLAGLLKMRNKLQADEIRRKQAEAELRIAACAFESQEAMMVTDAQSVILRVNKAFSRTTGYTAEEAIGQTPRLLQSGRHDRDFYRAMWESILRTGGWQGEILDRRKNGEVYPTWLTISAVKDDQGAVTHYIGTHFDLTERKQAEQSLIFSEEKFSKAFHASPDWVVISRRDTGELLDVNEGFERISGYTRAEALGRTSQELGIWADPSVRAEAVRRLNEQGSVSNVEALFNRRGGGTCWMNFSFESIELGGEACMLGVGRDITERKLMEHEVHQLAFYDALTKLPNRRLLNDRLNQAMLASKRSACYGALMFLDLDNFKPLNDMRGHGVGDLLLIEAADRLKSCVREIDTVARFGGDEFVVLLSDLNADKAESAAQAQVIAEKIRVTLSAPYFLTIKHEGQADTRIEHHCTASIGVALFINHEASQTDILKWADSAMYQAKEAGRNLIRFHDSKL